MISINNIIRKHEIKSFHNNKKMSTKSSYFDNVSSVTDGTNQLKKKPLEICNVTSCLTHHNECSGKYIDYTRKFLINCSCQCHNHPGTITTKRVG